MAKHEENLDMSGSYLLRKNSGGSDWVFSVVIWACLALVVIAVAYPLYFVLVASFSDPADVAMGRTLLGPVGVYLDGYKEIFNYERIWIAYGNTIFYTVSGTLLHLLLTIPIAYTLSRRQLLLNGAISTIFLYIY